MTPTAELTIEQFDCVVNDSIDVVTQVYVEARQCLRYIDNSLRQRNPSCPLSVVGVYGKSLGKMADSTLRSWVGIVAWEGLDGRRADEPLSDADDDGEGRRRREPHDIKPGSRILFAKIVLRTIPVRSTPHILLGVIRQCRLFGESSVSVEPLRIRAGEFSDVIDAMHEGLQQTEPDWVNTKAAVVSPRSGSLSVRLAAPPIRKSLFDIGVPEDLNPVIDQMLAQ